MYFDHTGKRREHSTRTTDRQAAERILNKLVADTALRRDLVIDPRAEHLAKNGRSPLISHIDAYIAHCNRIGLATLHVSHKSRHLRAVAQEPGVTRLCDLTADAMERYLSNLKDLGRSPRTVNFARQLVTAFANWCVKTGRIESNPIATVAIVDESRDRRRVRRPLTDEELARLIAVATEHGREAWYLAAALAGLRRGDLVNLVWADVNFTDRTLTIRHGKAKREDVLSMHPQLADALKRRLEAFPALPMAKVWATPIDNETRRRDFIAAGITLIDDEGKSADLQALRTTLGTQLARAGVTPQVAQRIMRLSDYRTTLKHYTVLGLADTAAAIDRLPGIAAPDNSAEATGTTDSTPANPQQYCKQLERNRVVSRAQGRAANSRDTEPTNSNKPQQMPGFSRDSAEDLRMERAKHQ